MALLHPNSVLRAQGPLLFLIGFIAICFFLQLILGPLAYFRLMALPAEIVASWEALRSGTFDSSDLRPLGTLFSYALLHGNFGHLFGNMIFLWIFAALAAELLGHRWMLLTFVFTAITGGVCHVALNPEEFVPMLGASGAVAGFEGLYLALAVRWQLPDPHVWPFARPIPPAQLAALGVFGLAVDFMSYTSGQVGVAYGAHLGGFIGGILLGGMIVPMPKVARPR